MSNELFNNPFSGSAKREPMTLAELLYVFKIYRYFYVAFIFLASFVTIYSHLSYVPSYVATAKVAMTDKKSETSALMSGIGLGPSSAESDDQQLQKYIGYMKTSGFMLSVAQELKFGKKSSPVNLMPPTKKKFDLWGFLSSQENKEVSLEPQYTDLTLIPVERLADIIGGMAIIRSGEMNSMLISVSSANGNTALVLANLIAETFTNQIMSKDRQELNEVQAFIEDRLKETTEKMQKSETDLINYRKNNNIVSTSDSTRSTLDRFSRIESDEEQIKIRIRENEKLLTYFQGKLEQKDQEILQAKEAPTTGEDASVIRSRIETLRKQQASLRDLGVKESESAMTGINKDLSENSERLKSFLSTSAARNDSVYMDSESIHQRIAGLRQEIKQLSVKLTEIQATRNELKSTLTQLPQMEQEKQSLERSVNLQYELYTQLKKRLQEVEIQRAGLKSPVRIEELAKQSASTSPPRLILRLIFSVMAGFFFGCVLTLVGELLNSTVKHRADLETAELVGLGNIPFFETRSKSPRVNEQYRPDLLICAREPDSAESMAFKFLRAQIRNLPNSGEGKGHVIAISSSDRAAGKSLVSANLAVSFSQLQRKTIIVDCDIRNPTQPKYFGFENRVGIASLLEMKVSLSDVIIKEKLPNLDILPAGSINTNPTEILSGDKFKMLINYLKSKYEYVIIDSPPALFVVDAAIVTALADTAILIGRYRVTKRDALMMAHRKILQISPKTVYGILNGIHGVHEYTKYDANSYFENKMKGIRAFQFGRKKLESVSDLKDFEGHLDGKKKNNLDKTG